MSLIICVLTRCPLVQQSLSTPQLQPSRYELRPKIFCSTFLYVFIHVIQTFTDCCQHHSHCLCCLRAYAVYTLSFSFFNIVLCTSSLVLVFSVIIQFNIVVFLSNVCAFAFPTTRTWSECGLRHVRGVFASVPEVRTHPQRRWFSAQFNCIRPRHCPFYPDSEWMYPFPSTPFSTTHTLLFNDLSSLFSLSLSSDGSMICLHAFLRPLRASNRVSILGARLKMKKLTLKFFQLQFFIFFSRRTS